MSTAAYISLTAGIIGCSLGLVMCILAIIRRRKAKRRQNAGTITTHVVDQNYNMFRGGNITHPSTVTVLSRQPASYADPSAPFHQNMPQPPAYGTQPPAYGKQAPYNPDFAQPINVPRY